MALSTEQKNTVVVLGEDLSGELIRIAGKITARTDQFKTKEKATRGTIQTDLTKLSKAELKTKIRVLSKIHAEIVNLEGSVRMEIQKADRELVRRP